MSKIRLVMLEPSNDYYRPCLEPIFNEYFQFEQFDTTKDYDKKCIFLLGGYDLDDKFKSKYLDNGYKLIVSNLWEAAPFVSLMKIRDYPNVAIAIGAVNSELQNRVPNKIISVPNWFWYYESLNLAHEKVAEDYIPNRTNEKLFLMPIRRAKPFRDRIIHKFENLLDNSIYSYQYGWRNKDLPRYTSTWMDIIAPDRVFEKEWYDQTYFTVVVETTVGTDTLGPSGTTPELFITEKTYKPIAYKHPFMILGSPNTLKSLKSNGFETYDNLFDESYDSIEVFENRLDKVYNNILTFDYNKYKDPSIEQKIKHNHNLFYNKEIVKQRLVSELIEPMLEWINAT